MKARKPVCPYCCKLFEPSPFHPKQTVCLSQACQRRRRSDYHRNKIATDTAYRQQCVDSRTKWRENHPDYQRLYRNTHQAYTEQNRAKQRQRNKKRKLALIVKNNLALDVKRLPAEVWMAGPGLDAIVKNNLAIPEVFILHAVGNFTTSSLTDCKEQRFEHRNRGELYRDHTRRCRRW